MLSKKQPEFKYVANSEPVQIANMREFFEEETQGVAGLSFSKEIMELYRQKHCQFKLQWTE